MLENLMNTVRVLFEYPRMQYEITFEDYKSGIDQNKELSWTIQWYNIIDNFKGYFDVY